MTAQLNLDDLLGCGANDRYGITSQFLGTSTDNRTSSNDNAFIVPMLLSERMKEEGGKVFAFFLKKKKS